MSKMNHLMDDIDALISTGKNTHKDFLDKPILGIFYRFPKDMSFQEWEIWSEKAYKKYPIQFLIREYCNAAIEWVALKFAYVKYLFKRKYKPFNVFTIKNLPNEYCPNDIVLEEFIEQTFMSLVDKNGKVFLSMPNPTDEDAKKCTELFEKLYTFYTDEKPQHIKNLKKLRDELFEHTKGDLSSILNGDARTSNILEDLVKEENILFNKITEHCNTIISNRSLFWRV